MKGVQHVVCGEHGMKRVVVASDEIQNRGGAIGAHLTKRPRRRHAANCAVAEQQIVSGCC